MNQNHNEQDFRALFWSVFVSVLQIYTICYSPIKLLLFQFLFFIVMDENESIIILALSCIWIAIPSKFNILLSM